MNRIDKYFNKLKADKKKAFGVFLTAGYPNITFSEKILKKIVKSNIDFIEIGLPFSDPMADGPLIQESSEVALKNNVSVTTCFNLVKSIRKLNNNIPIILMGYYNPIYYYGNLEFIKKSKISGIDGLIIVDLPMEEDDEFFNLSIENDLPVIRFVTPTTDAKRLKKIIKLARGFIYYIAVTGITGTQSASLMEVKNNIKTLKKFTDLPIIAGFGIKTPTDAVNMSKFADGVVIGSVLIDKVKKISKNLNGVNELSKFLNKFTSKF